MTYNTVQKPKVNNKRGVNKMSTTKGTSNNNEKVASSLEAEKQAKQNNKKPKTSQNKAVKPKKEREYLTAVTICGGIITLINSDGTIGYYRQRGIKKFSDHDRQMLIGAGLLQRNWEQYKELPSHISISFEDPEIQGKARATYPGPEEIIKLFKYSGV